MIENENIPLEQVALSAPTEMEKREAYLNGLEDMIMFLREHPEIDFLQVTEFIKYVWGKVNIALSAKFLGSSEKEYTDWSVKVFKRFGPIKVGFYTSRDLVCEKKVVGKRIVPAEPSYYREEVPEHEEDVIEWVCGSILDPGKPEDQI